MQIKLIWDFKGQASKQIATHHAIHLNEFIEKEKLQNMRSGVEEINEFYHIAFLIVDNQDMLAMRDALRPHRGEYV